MYRVKLYMKEKILQCKINNPTWGYRKIAKELGCAASSVKYYLDPTAKAKNLARKHNWHRRLNGIMKRKKDNFQRIGEFKYIPSIRGSIRGRMPSLFSSKQLKDKLGTNPFCYITGRKIDLLSPESFQLDHIVPVSKGGDNSLENCGLTCRSANMAKHDLSLPELEALCIEILQHRGYTVSGG